MEIKESEYIYTNNSICIVELMLPTDAAEMFRKRFTWIRDSKLSKEQNENCLALYSNPHHAHGGISDKHKAIEPFLNVTVTIDIILTFSEEYITSLYYEFPVDKITFLRISKGSTAAAKENPDLYAVKHGGISWFIRLILRQIALDLNIPPDCIQDAKLFEMQIKILTKTGILVSYDKDICFRAMALNYRDLLMFYDNGGHRAQFSRKSGILEELRSKTNSWTNFASEILKKNDRLLKCLDQHTIAEIGHVQILDDKNHNFKDINGQFGEVIDHYDFENEQFTVKMLNSDSKQDIIKISPENVKPIPNSMSETLNEVV